MVTAPKRTCKLLHLIATPIVTIMTTITSSDDNTDNNINSDIVNSNKIFAIANDSYSMNVDNNIDIDNVKSKKIFAIANDSYSMNDDNSTVRINKLAAESMTTQKTRTPATTQHTTAN